MGKIKKKVQSGAKSLNKAKIQKTFEVKVFSKSEELSFLNRIVNSGLYDDSVLFHKLFFSYANCQDGSPKEYYLKNEYLYLTTKGVISYLRSRKTKDDRFFSSEKQILLGVIESMLAENEEKLNIISLGASDSSKEITVFDELKKKKIINRINYFPVDVSPILIQLGINNFSAKNDFFSDDSESLNVSSIVANIWDLAKYIHSKPEERSNLFGTGKRLFLLLGGTLGNFEERDVLNQVIELMGDGDRLILSVELKEERSGGNKENDYMGDSSFLLAPLNYIPFFYGYTMYHRDFLVKGDKAKIEYSTDKHNLEVQESECTAPFIDVAKREGGNIIHQKVHLARNTRYKLDMLKNWLRNDYRFFDGCNYYKLKTESEKTEKSIASLDLVKEATVFESDKNYDKLRYDAHYDHLNRVVFEKSYKVKLFSDSEELSFISQINDRVNGSDGDYKREYRDRNTFFKLFNQYDDVGSSMESSDFYLKNKYLYVTTTGIMNYLRLYESQKKTLEEFFRFEKYELADAIIGLLRSLDDNSMLNIVSLGAAISDKEAEVLRDIVEDDEIKKKIRYYPVDISPMLIQLGLNSFAKDPVYQDFEVNPIVADFWSMARYIKSTDDGLKGERRKEFFGEGKRLFLIMGGTFGNYSEKEFLDQVLEMMDEGDELLVSVKLQHPEDNYTPDKDYINLPGNEDFLLEPLKYIPLYYGYSRYYRDFLVTDKNANLSENDDEMKFVSVVPKSECTAPFIEVDGIGNNMQRAKIRLCWSTRYDKIT